jgi:hypothetical protein
MKLADKPRLRVKRRLDWSQIKKEVKAAMERREITSLQKLSRRLGVDQSFLADKIGADTKQQIVEESARVRKDRAAASFEELCRQIRAASMTLVASGVRPSGRAIGATLGVNASTPRFRAALEKVRSEESAVTEAVFPG